MAESTLLIVDDSPDDRTFYRYYLLKDPQHSYTVLEAENGEEALAICRQHSIDCMVLDYRLPDKNGLEVLRSVVQDQGTDVCAVIMLTGNSEIAVAVDAMKLGAHDYLEKDRLTAENLRHGVANAIDKCRLQRELEQQRQLTAVTLASIGDAVITTDNAGRITFMNGMAEQLTGWSQAEALEQPLETVFRIVDEGSRETVENPVVRALCDRSVVGLVSDHTLLLARDGRAIPIDDSAAPIRLRKDEIRGAVLAFHDITEQRQRQKAIHDSEERFRQVATMASNWIWEQDETGCYVYCSGAVKDILGYSPEEMLSHHYSEFFLQEQPEALTASPARLAELPLRFLRLINHYRHKHGQLIITESSGEPILDERGNIIGWRGVDRDITAQVQSEKQLQEQAERLREADRLKDEFLAILAHELRNPLAPIRNVVETLPRLQEDKLASEMRTIGAILERQVALLTRLVDDLVDLSRITRGQLVLHKSPVELAGVIQSAVELSRPMLQQMDQQLELSLPVTPILIEADPVRLSQVFMNLLSNSAKYSAAGNTIKLSVVPRNQDVIVRVKDNGIGIAADKLPYLFKMFYQVAPIEQRSRNGLGIGLSLVQRLVAMHGGSVKAHSEGLGKGSEFIVCLPILHNTGVTPQKTEENDVAPLTAHSVLVVDDNRDAAESMAVLLQLDGNEVHLAYNGNDAVTMAERLRPKVILMDIGMPGLNGFDAARKIRSAPWGKDMVLIAQSGWGQEEDRQLSREAGFDAHLVKPINMGELSKVLTELLA